MASPLSLRKSAMVLKSGIKRPVSQTSSMLRWHSRSRRRLDCTRLRVSVDVNLQQRRRMIGRPSCRLRLNAAKAEPGQIKFINKDINRPDRIILGQILFQPLGKQRALTAVIANDKARHRIPPPNYRRIISLRVVFTQSGPLADISEARDRLREGLLAEKATSDRHTVKVTRLTHPGSLV